ncbi:MAG: hypothetical protein WKF67_03755 [Rubrobacteraceae bacterium]
MERDSEGASGRFENTGGATEQAKQQGQKFASQARRQAGELATRGGEQVKSQLANQKHEASQRLTPIQTALRETSQQLRKQGQTSTAGYTDRAADGVERVSGYLRETEVDEIVDEGRGFARRRPVLFLGGAATLGFLAARFLKSSSREGASAGDGSTDDGAPFRGTQEPTPVHRGIAERAEGPAAPAGGQPLEDRYAQMDRAEPPRGV